MNIPLNVDILPWINLLGFAVNGYLFWKRGTSEATDKLIALQKEQISALTASEELTRKRNHDLGNQIQVLSLKVGKMEGQLQEKDEKLHEYVAILQNRNPELEAALTSIGESLKEIHEFMKLLHGQTVARQ